MRHLLIYVALVGASKGTANLKEGKMEIPTMGGASCAENGVVASWCDSRSNPHLKCGLWESFDIYGCTCEDHSAECPEECVQEGKLIHRTKHSIQCSHIPMDQPNYVLKEVKHSKRSLPLHHCENNAVVASWCDESVNPNVDCRLKPHLNQYTCSCQGHHAECPSECIGESKILESSHYLIVCSDIPQDIPNYVLTS